MYWSHYKYRDSEGRPRQTIHVGKDVPNIDWYEAYRFQNEGDFEKYIIHEGLGPRPTCNCLCSSGLNGELTFGKGNLSQNGYWQYPCYACARWHEKELPMYTYWPRKK